MDFSRIINNNPNTSRRREEERERHDNLQHSEITHDRFDDLIHKNLDDIIHEQRPITRRIPAENSTSSTKTNIKAKPRPIQVHFSEELLNKIISTSKPSHKISTNLKKLPSVEKTLNIQSVENEPIFQHEVETICNLVNRISREEIDENEIHLIPLHIKITDIKSLEDNTETQIYTIFPQLYNSVLPNEFIYTIMIVDCGPFTVFQLEDSIFIRYMDSRTGKKYEYNLDKHYTYYSYKSADLLFLFAKTNKDVIVSPARPPPNSSIISDVKNKCEII